MRGVKSLAQIAEEQQKLSDSAAIGVRLGATAVILALSAAAGRWDAAIADASVLRRPRRALLHDRPVFPQKSLDGSALSSLPSCWIRRE